MPTRETRNSTLGRGSVVRSDTTPKKGIPMIRNKNSTSTHGSDHGGRKVAAPTADLNGGIAIGGNTSPTLISCSKCGRKFKSNAGFAAHMRRIVPCDYRDPSPISSPDPPAKSTDDARKSLPTPALMTGGGNVNKALVGLLAGLLVGLLVGVFDALLGLAIGLLVGFIVGAVDTLGRCLPFGGSAFGMTVRSPEVKTGPCNTVSDPREADVEALLKKWNQENPKDLARHILLAMSESPTSALISGVAAKVREPNFDLVIQLGPDVAAKKLIQFICRDIDDGADDDADNFVSPSVSRELFPEKRKGGLLSIFRRSRPSMGLEQVVAVLKGLENTVKGVKGEQKRYWKEINTIKKHLNTYVNATSNDIFGLYKLHDVSEHEEQQQQLAAKIEMMSPNEI